MARRLEDRKIFFAAQGPQIGPDLGGNHIIRHYFLPFSPIYALNLDLFAAALLQLYTGAAVTGSPAGVGYGRDPKIFMRDGDIVEVELQDVGVLSNPVTAGP